MEKTTTVQEIKEKVRQNKQVPVKDYKKMYEDGWDAFSVLGVSKFQHDLMKNANSVRIIIEKTLNETNITRETTPAFLAQMKGVTIGTFDELASLIEEDYYNNQRIQNEELQNYVKICTLRVKEKIADIYDRKTKMSVQDFIGLTQHKSIQDVSNKLDPSLLLTKETLKANGLELAEYATAYAKHPITKEDLFGWPNVKTYWHSNELDMPLKDYYHNQTLLNETEQNFSNLQTFYNHTTAKGYKLLPIIKASTLEDTVLMKGKKIMYDASAPLSETEKALLMMYELNLDYLQPKRKTLSIRKKDEVKKELKEFFNKRMQEKIELEDNARLAYKMDKKNFEQYFQTIKDVVATLATINQARIYMTGDAFKKVEQNLTIQASMKLSTLPRTHSTWVMSYIAQKVYEVSKKNYMEVGITSISQLKELYENTGRDVKNATTGEEIMYSSLKQLEKTVEKPEIIEPKKEKEPESIELDESLIDVSEKMNDSKEKTEVVEEDFNQPVKEGEVRNLLDSDLLKAKDSLRIFLDENLLMKNSFSETPAIDGNMTYIEKLNEQNMNMQLVSDYIYNKIIDDMQANSAYYKKPDGNYHKYGVQLLKDYFDSTKTAAKPRETFKKLLKEAEHKIRKDEQIDVAKTTNEHQSEY